MANDVCVCSRTCKRLQMLAEQHFRRKFRVEVNKEVEVMIGSDGKLHVSPNRNYVKCFQKFITNIRIVFYDDQDSESEEDESEEDESEEDESEDENRMLLIANWMKRKCNKKINKICIGGNIYLDLFCKKIKSILRGAEIVVFKDRNRSGVDEAKFLTYCPNITKLILEDGVAARNCEAIFQQKYRKLEHFYYLRSYVSDLRVNHLKTFFRQHPNITTVAWMFHYDDIADPALQCLQSVDYIINLEHMYLHIDRLLADDFNTIYNYLNVLCNRHNFQCLEIEFDGEEGAAAFKANSNFLASLKKFTKIHVTDMFLTEMIPSLQSLTFLKTIVLTGLIIEQDWDEYWEDVVVLVDNLQNVDLPSIEEVYLVDIDDEFMYTYILLIVRHWTKLKRIFLPACMYSDTVLNNSILGQLSEQRLKLKNACELTIFTNHEGNTTNLNHDLVKVKFVEFRFNDFQKYSTVGD